jgi:hypothetical protein
MESIMAKTTDELPAEPKMQPNIDAIIDLLKPGGELEEAAKQKQSGASAEGLVFQRIEKNLHGNRAAVSDMRRIRKWPRDKQFDYIRTFEPLLVHYGLTLEVIDPEDLVAQAQKKQAEGEGDEGQAPDAGSNAGANALDAARTNLTGGEPGDDASRERAAAANGSVQLRKFVGALRAGMSVDDAATLAEIEPQEAAMQAAAEEKGELANIDAIAPPVKRGKPKLGIVAPASDTKQ